MAPTASSSRPRIAEVIWGLDRGEAEVLLLERLRASDLEAADYTVVVARPELRELKADFDGLGVPVIFPGVGARPLLAAIRQLRPHVVNVHSPRPALWLKAAHRLGYFGRGGPRLIETAHSETYGHPMVESLSASLNSSLERVIAVSEAVGRSRQIGHAPHINVVRPGVNCRDILSWPAAEAQAMRQQLGVDADVVALAMVAGFRRAKNHLRLVAAVEQMMKSGDSVGPFVVLLAGDGPTRDEVERAVKAKGLGEQIRFLGPVARGWQVIASCDAALLTSDREGSPVVVAEALVVGRPVISTAVGGVPELVTHGRNGLLFEPNVGSAARAMADFVGDAELRRRMQRPYPRDVAHLDITQTAAEMQRIYGVARATDVTTAFHCGATALV